MKLKMNGFQADSQTVGGIAMLSISTIRDRIIPVCKKYPIRKAYLFGSYARGNATEKSDVDLRIEGDIKSFFMLGGIYSDLADALGTELDLLSKLPDSEAFKENIKKDEVLLYER
jgi:hypothetical protein